jgi:hypothetical protein
MKIVEQIKRYLMKRRVIFTYWSDNFSIRIGLKQDVLSPLLFNFALDDAIRKVKGNKLRLKLNGTHQMLDYADDVNLLGDNIDTIEKNIETLIKVSRDVDVDVNTHKISICCCFVSRMQGKILR